MEVWHTLAGSRDLFRDGGTVPKDTTDKRRPRELHGRSQIFSAETAVTRDNVVGIVQQALLNHTQNAVDIDYLWKYYKGVQPILWREKGVRPEIDNRVVENRANEIVAFKVGYLYGEPIQYVSHQGVDDTVDAIGRLNAMMLSESKASHDKDLGEWQEICGTSYRYVTPDSSFDEDSPFEVYTLDPRSTAVVYRNDVTRRPLLAFTIARDPLTNLDDIISVYTETEFFKIRGSEIIAHEGHILGAIPIIEYPANNARLGSFEIVINLLDAINTLTSNRVDDVVQLVQSLLKFLDCDIDEETYDKMMAKGAIKIKSVDGSPRADVEYISPSLDQNYAQTLADHLYGTVLNICGIPSRSGTASTSDTGVAVLLRDGWSLAEARAKDSELMFKRSEREFLRIVLRICEASGESLGIKVSDVDMKFTRRNYEAIQSKAQVLTMMLAEDKIHPLLAFSHCGMFSDPEAAYRESEEYKKEQAPQSPAESVQKLDDTLEV
jgi:SPP1 family phage portal protein